MVNRSTLILCITCLVSFCSMCYELLLAQALSAFLENTVLRYCVTIGLYLFAMGLGARMVEGKVLKFPSSQLLKIEIVLTCIGGLVIMWLYGLDYMFGHTLIFSLLAHSLILVIGFLTGMELPILMEMYKDHSKEGESTILGISYFGAVLATFVFAFLFYPKIGLLRSALFVGILNASAGLLLNFCRPVDKTDGQKGFYIALYVQLAMFFMICVFLLYSNGLNQFLLDLYLSKGR